MNLANAAQWREALAAAAAQHSIIVVDMTVNRFCDSSGISALIVAHKQVGAAGGELRLATASPAVRRVFKVTGVGRLFRSLTACPRRLLCSR